jgi:hypothetical protein
MATHGGEGPQLHCPLSHTAVFATLPPHDAHGSVGASPEQSPSDAALQWQTSARTAASASATDASPCLFIRPSYFWASPHVTQIASSGSGYFVAWQTGSTNAAGAIWGRLLDATGAPLGPPILVSVPPNGFIGDPIVVGTGAEYVVLFPVGQGTWYTVRVDPSGNVVDANVGNIDVPVGDTVSFIGGNNQLFSIIATGQEVDVNAFVGTPGGYLSATGGVAIYFTATQASATWLDATRESSSASMRAARASRSTRVSSRAMRAHLARTRAPRAPQAARRVARAASARREARRPGRRSPGFSSQASRSRGAAEREAAGARCAVSPKTGELPGPR